MSDNSKKPPQTLEATLHEASEEFGTDYFERLLQSQQNALYSAAPMSEGIPAALAEPASSPVSLDSPVTEQEFAPLKRRGWGFARNFIERFKSVDEPTKDEHTEIAPVDPQKGAGRGEGARQKAVAALRWFVDQNAEEYSGMRTASPPGKPPRDLPMPRIHTRSFVNDFHLMGLEMLAEKIEHCDGKSYCNSLWCSECKKRFGAKNLASMQQLISARYGDDETRIRENVLHLTVLNELIIPDPEVRRSKEHGRYANFAASKVKRDHIDLLSGLERIQKMQLNLMERILERKNLKLDHFLDKSRDRSSPRLENFWHDFETLFKLNRDIDAAHQLYKGRKKVEVPKEPVSRPVNDGSEGFLDEYSVYLTQLWKAKQLSEREIHEIALALQWIYRDFRSITRTRFPEHLKLKSSIEKVIKRERKKLYSILRDLPNLSISGTFEIELIDLVHASENFHPNKVETLRLLAGQKRKRDVRPEDRIITDDLNSRSVKSRLLDNLRTQFHLGEEISWQDYPELRYAILLHIHAVVDLNGTPREDLEQWLKGSQGLSRRRFKPKWPLSRQVKLNKLYADRSPARSLVSLGFYPFKSALGFNYEFSENSTADPEFRRESKTFSEHELAILVWLQHSLGFPGLAIRINTEQDYETRETPKSGRKPKRSAMSIFPELDEFQKEVHAILTERGDLETYLQTLGVDDPVESHQTYLDEAFESILTETGNETTSSTSSLSERISHLNPDPSET